MVQLHRTGPLLHELCCDQPLGAAACPFSLLPLSVSRYRAVTPSGSRCFCSAWFLTAASPAKRSRS